MVWSLLVLVLFTSEAEAIADMARTYTFLFYPEPEGGYTVTCSALPGLARRDARRSATHGV